MIKKIAAATVFYLNLCFLIGAALPEPTDDLDVRLPLEASLALDHLVEKRFISEDDAKLLATEVVRRPRFLPIIENISSAIFGLDEWASLLDLTREAQSISQTRKDSLNAYELSLYAARESIENLASMLRQGVPFSLWFERNLDHMTQTLNGYKDAYEHGLSSSRHDLIFSFYPIGAEFSLSRYSIEVASNYFSAELGLLQYLYSNLTESEQRRCTGTIPESPLMSLSGIGRALGLTSSQASQGSALRVALIAAIRSDAPLPDRDTFIAHLSEPVYNEYVVALNHDEVMKFKKVNELAKRITSKNTQFNLDSRKLILCMQNYIRKQKGGDQFSKYVERALTQRANDQRAIERQRAEERKAAKRKAKKKKKAMEIRAANSRIKGQEREPEMADIQPVSTTVTRPRPEPELEIPTERIVPKVKTRPVSAGEDEEEGIPAEVKAQDEIFHHGYSAEIALDRYSKNLQQIFSVDIKSIPYRTVASLLDNLGVRIDNVSGSHESRIYRGYRGEDRKFILVRVHSGGETHLHEGAMKSLRNNLYLMLGYYRLQAIGIDEKILKTLDLAAHKYAASRPTRELRYHQ